jgi:predicted dehydrogenase
MTSDTRTHCPRVAVVGVGALGQHHASKLSALDNVQLVAVADTNPTQGKRVAELNNCEWVADYRELFDRIDAVSIAVPTVAHLTVASQFLERQIAVFVEKPIASTLDEARQLVECADTNDCLIQIGHIERFNPATEVAWQHSGPPKYIRAERVSPYTFRSTDIGVVHDLMIHDIDLILDLVRSPVQAVQAFGVSIAGGHEDTVQARLNFDNGCIADITASRMSPAAHRTMQIWSQVGCVNVDFTTRDVTCFEPSDALMFGKPLCERPSEPGCDLDQLRTQVFGRFIRRARPKVSAADALEAELASFMNCVRENSRPVVGGPEALAAMEVAEQVLASVAKHQWDGIPNQNIGPFARPIDQQRRAG